MLIGIAGGISTGKSTVARIFEELGARIILADEEARKLMQPDSPVLAEVLAAFPEVALADGSLDRAALANLIFSSSEGMQRLNSITDPALETILRKRILEESAQLSPEEGIIVLEAAILPRLELLEELDVLIWTECSRKTQCDRAEERFHLTAEQAEERLEAQAHLEWARDGADYLINTDKPLPEVRKEILEIWQDVQERC